MTAVEIEIDFSYEAAHWLPNVPDGHKCKTLHGHSYHLTVALSGAVHAELGWVADYADVRAAVAPTIKCLDHTTINELIENPTCENQLRWLWRQFTASDQRSPAEGWPEGLYLLSRLTLSETANARANYYGPRDR